MLDYNSFSFFANLFPLVLLLLPFYRLIKNVVVRRLLLAAAGLYLLVLIAPRLALFYVGYWLVVWVAQLLVAATAERRRGWIVNTVAIVLLLLPMVTWKLWAQVFIIDFNLWFDNAVLALPGPWGSIDLVRDIILPLGLSFSTFRAVDLIIKTYLGVVERLRIDELLFFGFFPPVLLIGPVIQYTEIRDAVRPGRTVVWDDLRAGLLLVISGLFKVFVIAWPLEGAAQLFVYYGTNELTVRWVELFLFAIYFFFNFAGYSDLAVGAARILGFDIARNFNWPYTKTNPQEFWNSWHMSLTHFFQRNVYVPLGGMRPQTQFRAIFLTIMCIALWHDISIPLIVFGLYHAAGLIGHRLLRGRRPPPLKQSVWRMTPKAVGVFVFVAVSMPLVVLRTDQIVPFYSSLVGAS